MEDLVTDVVVNDTVQQGNNHPGTEQVWRLGHASTHFTHVQGPFLIHNGNNADDMANCQAWLRNKFTGAASEDAAVSGPATWFIEMNVKARNR